MRVISKQRIKFPTKAREAATYLDPELLQKIYDKIIEKYTTQGLKRPKPE